MNKIDNNYTKALITQIRNRSTEAELLQKNLYSLGTLMGQTIAGDFFTQKEEVSTPLDYQYSGLGFIDKTIVVICTKDEYNYFAKGVASAMDNILLGYMDFEGVRGVQALSQPIRAISFPELKQGQFVDFLIVAKSVLATGCTAISLTKKAIEYYNPKSLIIATVFYTNQGIFDIRRSFPNSFIYVFGEPDNINEDGLIYPGVGMLDERMKTEG